MSRRFLVPGILACVWVLPFLRAESPSSAWPFDAADAHRRQQETAQSLGLPVTRQLKIADADPLDMVLIPAGTYTMGTPEAEPTRSRSEQRHEVHITTAFYLATDVVTQGQWQAVMKGNPSLFKKSPDSPRRPVEHVSYLQITNEFVPKLQANVPAGWVVRLPTEAEWEWACRAGTATAFWFGDKISTEQANYDGSKVEAIGTPGSKRGETTPVLSFPANPWGLNNMHGNVFQWCSDCFGPYPKGPVDDPIVTTVTKGDDHVLRGGCWIHPASKCRSGARYFSPATYFAGSIGFRLALAPAAKTVAH